MTGIQVYNAEALAKLKSWLGMMAEKNHKKFFEIFVDNARVVHKTDDLSEFDDHEMWVDDKTKVIRVLVYNTEGSHRYQPFEYRTENYLNELEQAKQKSDLKLQQSLSGLDVDKKIESALDKQKQEFAFDALKKENVDLKQRVKEADEYINRLENKLETYEAQKFKLNQDTIISVGAGILNGVVKMNPEIMNKIPAAALNGIAAVVSHSAAAEKSEPDTEVTITKKGAAKVETQEEEEDELDEDTEVKLAFLESLEDKLSEDDLKKVFSMMLYLRENPQHVAAAFELVVPASYRQAA
jgi:hypothetical protein